MVDLSIYLVKSSLLLPYFSKTSLGWPKSRKNAAISVVVDTTLKKLALIIKS